MSEAIKPRPMCCAEMEPWGVNYRHPDNDCYFNFSLVPPDHVALWNRRAKPECKLTDAEIRTIAYKSGFRNKWYRPGFGSELASSVFVFARAILAAQPAADPHPPTRHCMCDDCKPSFPDDVSDGEIYATKPASNSVIRDFRTTAELSNSVVKDSFTTDTPSNSVGASSAHTADQFNDAVKKVDADHLGDFNEKMQPAPIDSIRAILKGIDQVENERGDGWWETQSQAEFGADKMRQIEALFNAPREAQPAAATVPDEPPATLLTAQQWAELNNVAFMLEHLNEPGMADQVQAICDAADISAKAAQPQDDGENMHTQSTHQENVSKNEPISYACDRTGMMMPFRCGDCGCWSNK